MRYYDEDQMRTAIIAAIKFGDNSGHEAIQKGMPDYAERYLKEISSDAWNFNPAEAVDVGTLGRIAWNRAEERMRSIEERLDWLRDQRAEEP